MRTRTLAPAALAAVLLAAGGGCSWGDTVDAAVSVIGGDDGPIYRPELQPLGWSADGERVRFVHTELEGGYDYADLRCGGSGVYEADGESPPRPIAVGEPWCERAAGWMLAFSLSADGRTVYVLPEHDSGGECTGVAALDLDARRWREAGRICGSYVYGPAVSPDGRRIAATLGCGSVHGGGGPSRVTPRGCVDTDGDRITVMDLDGSARRLVGEPGDEDPGWSPDGLALTVRPTGEGDGDRIAVIDLRTGRRRVLTDGSGAAWSPDGQWLAFTRHPRSDGGRVTLHVIRADGTGERTVYTQSRRDMRRGPQYPSPGGWPGDPMWSPDGRRIVFTKHSQSGNTLWIINADGTGLRLLSERIEAAE